MRAGDKDRRIRVEALSVSRSSTGAAVETWNLYKEVWAKVSLIYPLKGIEKATSDGVTSEEFTQFKIDFISGLSPKQHRIVYNGLVYDIWYIAEFGYREALLIKARALAIPGVGDGISGTQQRAAPATVAEQTRMGTFSIATPDNTAVPVPLVSYAEYPFVIDGLNNLMVSAGSITLTIQINGVSVTGLTNLSVTNAPQNPVATGGNQVNVGDRVTFILTNNSAATNMEFTMKGNI